MAAKKSTRFPILQVFSVMRALIIIQGLFLSACVTNIPALPSPTSPEEAYQASVATIAAQLTAIAGTSVPELAGNPTTSASPIYTETLPPTSTPRPTDTPEPSETLEPTPTSLILTGLPAVVPTATLSNENPKANLGEADWIDSFESGLNWPLYNDDHVNMQVQNGQLVMTALIANRKDPWDDWMITQIELSDFYLEVAARPGECQGLDRYGLLARAASDASRAYVFGFSCDGRYSLRLWDGEKYFMLKEWTSDQNIQKEPDQVNRMGLLARGDRLTLYANDAFLAEFQDDTFTEGAIGLFAGAAITDGFRALFDQVMYWTIP